jgi:hypothetical protein
MRYLPYSSDAGPAIRGPTANARTKIETRRDSTVVSLSPNSRPTCDTAGAFEISIIHGFSTNIDEAKGDRNTYNAIIPVVCHFLLFGQFFGFIGSFGPSNVTRLSSIVASSGISSYD